MIYLLFGALVIVVVLAGAYVSLFAGHRDDDGALQSTAHLEAPHVPAAPGDAPVVAHVEVAVDAPPTPATERDP